ncbi:MAG: hypothetical protein IT385_20640 [Deltaproteobacteria bacterium]|nr:hypothetical protein [Deltaproteobacteria bacterium]
MNRLISSLVVASLTLVAFGCGKGEGGGGGAAAGGGGGEAPAAKPAALAFIPVPALGVQLELPGDAKPEQGAGDSFMIMSSSAPDCVVMLSKNKPEASNKFETVVGWIKEGKMGHGKLKAMSKEEQSPDGGWKLEWESEGKIGSKNQYGVDYRVVIDGMFFDCSRKTRTVEGRDCVAKACGSLKKI